MGWECPQDAAKAVEWFEKAASRKDLGAVMELGIMFRDGKYLPPDREKAFPGLKKGRNGRIRTAWLPWRICAGGNSFLQNRRPGPGLYREAPPPVISLRH